MLIIVTDLALEHAVHGVVLEQVRQGLVIRKIVHGHELDVRMILQNAGGDATDATESVDGYAHGEYRGLIVGW